MMSPSMGLAMGLHGFVVPSVGTALKCATGVRDDVWAYGAGTPEGGAGASSWFWRGDP